MAKILLEMENLRKSFGTRQVMDLDRLAVYDGDRIGLIGENGAGKTTLLRMIAGELEPDEGNIRRMGDAAFIHQQGNESGGRCFPPLLFAQTGVKVNFSKICGGNFLAGHLVFFRERNIVLCVFRVVILPFRENGIYCIPGGARHNAGHVQRRNIQDLVRQ